MSARPNRDPFSDVEPCEVRLGTLGEIAAGLPQLLGFRPAESVVLIGLGGASGGRVGMTVRADIPPEELAAVVARALVRSVSTDRPEAVVVAVVSEAPDLPGRAGRRGELPHRVLLHELTIALARAGIPLRDALLVRAGSWWSFDCPHACCLPGAGTPLPSGVTDLEIASIAMGVVVANSREALERRIEGPADATGVREACLRHAGERWALAAEQGWAAVADDACAAVEEALGVCAPGSGSGGQLTDELVARVLWGLRDNHVRDRVLATALGPDAAAAETLWTECTRRAPTPLDAAPATLLAVSTWLRGDGAMANVALDRALASDPDHLLAQLLSEALTACMKPEDLRAMIAAATGPEPRPAGPGAEPEPER
jgi:hypothetical protein